MKNKHWMFLFLFLSLHGCKTDFRPKIIHNTLYSYDNKILRGTTLWLYKYGLAHNENWYSLDPEFWKKQKEYGLNCFRVICFDPWEKRNGYVSLNLNDSIQLKLFLQKLDSIVKISEVLKMYVIINYHDTGKFEKEYIQQFWSVIAPRYAHNEFVVYELFNEPVQWSPKNYSKSFLDFQYALFKQVNAVAPETKTILFSFANTANDGAGKSMTDVVRKSGITDWETCLVGFHPYNTGHSSESIRELKENFPVFNTEQNIPGAPDLKNMDNEKWGLQTMERLEIGWCAWNMDDYARFKRNFIDGVYKDAVSKGYYWR